MLSNRSPGFAVEYFPKVMEMQWTEAITAHAEGVRTQILYKNIIDGRLLLYGKPSGKLLPNYFIHKPYGRLLCSCAISI